MLDVADLAAGLTDVEVNLGMDLFDYQVEAAHVWAAQRRVHPRLCLYYRTGAGKSTTALMLMALSGVQEVMVIAPPSTHKAWVAQGVTLGIAVEAVSHSKFRQKGFLVSRHKALIIDEFHLLGGHGGLGWKKADRLAKVLQAPLILASATPNYNDAERVYCIQHVLSPETVAGGFLQFLYTHCITEQNPYGQVPNVSGFQRFPDASAYLDSLPEVVYVPDNVVYTIEDVELKTSLPALFEDYGVDVPRGRIMASQMEARHRRDYYLRVAPDGIVHPNVMMAIATRIGPAGSKPVLIFCMSSKIARAIYEYLMSVNADVDLLTGKNTSVSKNEILDRFRDGKLRVLIGTATLATGTDGLDKVCDTLIIAHDTDDASQRRQLVGRILPRGLDTDASMKQVVRLVLDA